jgi:hypothetical protein
MLQEQQALLHEKHLLPYLLFQFLNRCYVELNPTVMKAAVELI